MIIGEKRLCNLIYTYLDTEIMSASDSGEYIKLTMEYYPNRESGFNKGIKAVKIF